MNRRRGFLLIELLCALAALCTLSGAAMVVFSAPNETRIVREEAEDLRSWLASRMARAAREGADFKLTVTDNDVNAIELYIVWYGGSNDLAHERYAAKRTYMSAGSVSAREHTFNGEWFTLTPAASFIIKSKRVSSIRLFVTAAGTGYVDIKESL